MNKTFLTVRRLPAARHSLSSYFVLVDGSERAEIPPESEIVECKVELEAGPHKIAIRVKSLGMDHRVSREIEINASGKPIALEATAYIRGILFWLAPLLPWLWFIGFTQNEVTLRQVAD